MSDDSDVSIDVMHDPSKISCPYTVRIYGPDTSMSFGLSDVGARKLTVELLRATDMWQEAIPDER